MLTSFPIAESIPIVEPLVRAWLFYIIVAGLTIVILRMLTP